MAREADVPGAGSRISFVNDRGIWHDLAQGAIQQTGNPLDIAIDGNAFLVVQTPNGERYSRNGALQINASGQLVTSQGMTVMGENGPIVFQPNDRNISVTADGRISVLEGANNKTESFRGKLRLVSFAAAQRLRKEEGSTFSAPAGVQAQPEPTARVVQGAIEKSNVNGVLEMTRMIELTRSYTQVATILQQQGELSRNAIQQLAEVPN